MDDNRFSHIAKDSRFRNMPKKDRKVKIDKRFQSMFSDKRFKTKYQVDKRGKQVQTSTNENLKKYYELNSSDEEEQNDDSISDIEESKDLSLRNKPSEIPKKGQVKTKKTKKKNVKEFTSEKSKKPNKKLTQDKPDSTSEEDENEEEEDNESNSDTKDVDEKEDENTSDESSEEDAEFKSTSDAIKEGIDVARGEGNLSSSSDEDDEDSTDNDSGVDEEEELDHGWAELEADAVDAEEITCRLALCNMDWDRIKAQDILVLMNSFKPQTGLVKNVKIYPSEYGLKRMEEDNRLGPVELRSKKQNPDDSSDDEPDEDLAQEKLRQYQLNRLKYYYAVVTCDSADTANHIYEQCDGLEYETSSARIDLRFIPDDMEFDHEPVSVADQLSTGSSYKPSSFVTTALNQTKVSLTWEETDPDRLQKTMRKFNKDEVDDMDLKAYLASDSEEENEKESQRETEINKFRSLLGGGPSAETEKIKDESMEMEITWEPGLKEKTEQAVLRKKKGGQTPWEKYLEKRAEKKREKLDEKMKKKKMAEEKDEESDEDSDHDDDEDDIPEGIDMNDPYFKDAFSDDENYEKPEQKKKQESKLSKKKKKRKNQPEETTADPNLELLVMDDDDQRQHFSLEQIMKNEQKKKKKNKKNVKNEGDIGAVEDTFKLNLDDNRFSAMYTSSAYNIDPSAPDYKSTKSMKAIVDEKLKRRAKEPVEGSSRVKKQKVDTQNTNTESIHNLVKSVKAKAKMSKEAKKSQKR